MCGIVGYVGWERCVEVLMEGLRNIEYRGYDSAGLALAKPGLGIETTKEAGDPATWLALSKSGTTWWVYGASMAKVPSTALQQGVAA